MAKVKKAHKRIIWSLSWAPDMKVFATGARDQVMKLWAVPDGKPEPKVQ